MKIVPFRWLVIVRDNGQTVAQYDVSMPEYGSKNFVATVTAFNKFRESELARSQSSRGFRRVSFTSWTEAESAKLIRADCKQSSLQAMCKEINYDLKNQEYLCN